jgi:hypothetical protein
MRLQDRASKRIYVFDGELTVFGVAVSPTRTQKTFFASTAQAADGRAPKAKTRVVIVQVWPAHLL